MLPGTPFPVVLAAALPQQQAGGGSSASAAQQQPILAVTWASVVGGSRGRSYLPIFAVR